MKYLGIVLCLWTCNLFAEWRPSDRFLHVVRQIESSDGRFIYGDDGRSLGDFQIRRGAWQDVNQWRKSRGLKTYDYQKNVFNKSISQVYAADYIALLHHQLQTQFKREPTPSEIYAAYNMGLTTFGEKCRFDLRRVNSVTAGKCQLIAELLSEPPVNLSGAQRLARN